MSRIIAGEYGGRQLTTPTGSRTRPTTDRTREALFASLEASADLADGSFLDLFAGSGAVGLEAISRGAPFAYFVDDSRDAVRVIEANIAALGVAGRARVLAVPARAAVSSLGDVGALTVFADPPYDVTSADIAELLGALLEVGAIDRDATVVVERDRRTEWLWPTAFEGLRDRRYGEARLWYGRPL